MRAIIFLLSLMPVFCFAQDVNLSGGYGRTNATNTWSQSQTFSGTATITGLTLSPGTTSLAPLIISPGTNLTSPASGAVEYDGTRFYLTDSNNARLSIQRLLFTQTSSVTVANTTTETALTGSGVGTLTLPANYGVTGRSIAIDGFGYHSATGLVNIRIRIYKGSTLILDTGSNASGVSTNALFQLRANITWRSSTTVIAQGFYQESGTGINNFPMVNTTTTTVSSTSEPLSITATWSIASTSDTITLTNLVIREAN